MERLLAKALSCSVPDTAEGSRSPGTETAHNRPGSTEACPGKTPAHSPDR